MRNQVFSFSAREEDAIIIDSYLKDCQNKGLQKSKVMVTALREYIKTEEARANRRISKPRIISPASTNNSFRDGNGEDRVNQKLSVDLLGEEDVKAWKDPSFQKALRERLADEQSIVATKSAETIYETLDRDNRKRGSNAARP
jgi:hypothetical protein